MSVMTLPDISFDYPKDLEGNIAYRDKMIALAENDEVIQELLKAHCRDNRLFFFNVFLFTYDPRRIFARNIPFITYPFQDESILWDANVADRGADNLFEKSRDMGVTWICVGNDIHDFLFKQEKIEIRWGSRKEDYVDKRGDMDSIFEKFRHAIKNLPIWMMPKGFSWKEHDNHMRLINPETDSSISGEATNDNFGRGGRKYRIRFDEFAFWACFSDDTEVLTKKGWQLVKDVTLKDKVYSMNPDNELAEYMPVTDVGKAHAKELINFTSKSVDLMVTKDHKMLLKKRRPVSRKGFKRFHFKKAIDVVGRKHDYIPLVSNYTNGKNVDKIHGYDASNWMEFLGWYVSEGHLIDKPRSRRIGIAQSNTANTKNYDRISELLKRMGIKHKEYDDTFIINKSSLSLALWDEIRSLGKAKEKHIPHKYLLLQPELLSYLFDSLILGDGTRRKRGNRVDILSYYSTSYLLASQVQIIAQKLGLKANVHTGKKRNKNWNILYTVSIGFKRNAHVTALKSYFVEYNKYAHCVTTPYHTLYVRRNGIASWCGNCDQAAWQGCADATLCRTALSTPNGPGNRFATLAKSNNIEMKTLHWTLHPNKVAGAYIIRKDGTKDMIDVEQDPQSAFKIWLKNRGEIAPPGMKGCIVRSIWYDKECKRRNKDSEIAEELDIDYLRSGFPFFDLRAVSRQVKYTLTQRLTPLESIPNSKYIRASLVDVDNKIEIREQPHGWLKIFEMPLKHGQYVLFGDTAEGLAKGDEAFAVVRDKYTRNVMATCNGSYDPDDFALKLQKIGALYNKCLTAPENNNHGYSVCSDLKQLDCNLYWTRKKDAKGKHTKTKAGFTTTATTRPQMLDQANEDISKDACEVRDPTIISQMETFVRNEKNGKPEADGDFLDDGVIAFAGAGIIIQEYPYNHKKTKTQDMTKFINRPRNGSFRFKRS